MRHRTLPIIMCIYIIEYIIMVSHPAMDRLHPG